MIARIVLQVGLSGYHLLISFDILKHRRFILDDSQNRAASGTFWLSFVSSG